jgi:hypothetical protein
MLALQQTPCIRLQFGRSLSHTLLQLSIQLLELPGLAIELNKDPDLGTQHLGYDRDRHIIYRAHFVAPHPVNIS